MTFEVFAIVHWENCKARLCRRCGQANRIQGWGALATTAKLLNIDNHAMGDHPKKLWSRIIHAKTGSASIPAVHQQKQNRPFMKERRLCKMCPSHAHTAKGEARQKTTGCTLTPPMSAKDTQPRLY